jgi:hypothetical protein
MSIYLQLLLVASVTIYIVDLSGFTQSWRSALARRMHTTETHLRPIKPFDCSLCMTWWVCLTYALIKGELSLPVIAYSALLSFLSVPIGQAMIFIREWLSWITDKLMPR